MTTLKSLMIGSAAAFVAVAGAQAASAPDKYSTKYEPAHGMPHRFLEHHRNRRLPARQRLRPFDRLGPERRQHQGHVADCCRRPITTADPDTDKSNWYSQARLRFDSRRNTDHGLLRAYAELQATDNDGNTGGNLALRLAFVQMGNWVFGKAVSAFTHGNSSPNGADFWALGSHRSVSARCVTPTRSVTV
jgi:hypothetical protein